jgi:UDP-glucose 4-epimerase
VEDIGDATASLVNMQTGPQIVNIGSGTDVSLAEVHRLSQETTGRTLAIDRQPGRDFDVPRVQLDIRALQSLVDFRPRALRDGIESTWRELLSRKEGAAGSTPVLPNVS